jgi:hypothetical protein
MKTISFPTGRTYDAPQILQITIESESTDEFGLQNVIATFNDASRHIKGRVEVIVFNDGIGQAVLESYDQGRYEII